MASTVPRYLVSFDPKRIPHYFTDVLIIGGGLAGLRAAMAIDDGLSVLIITKDEIQQSNSNYAQGGIAGVLDPQDRFEDHVADTLRAGGALCNQTIVEMVVREAPQRIQELIDWGAQFDEESGALMLGREGGHSARRVVHALGDSTGREVMRAVIARARSKPNLQIWEDTFTLDLLTHEQNCRGALVWHKTHGKTLIWAKQTILCTGGAGQVFRETTNPAVATGDGHAAAFRAGAELRDMEFMQFHPTVLYIAGSSRSLISEAMRGEGARLLDNTGHRFMPGYDPRAELAPRDVVSQAIVTQMEKTRHPNVYLDVSYLDPQHVRRRFPGIAAACSEFGIDITTEQIPVRPGAHYMIGGVTVDHSGRTTLPGLWAAGEVASSGLHGANRLASNSLLEGLVLGAHAGEGASECAAQMKDDFHAVPLNNPTPEQPSEPLDLADVRNSLKSLVWRAAGVRRDGQRLAQAAETIDNWCRYALVRDLSEPRGWELQNMLLLAQLLIRAAEERTESRGVHLRTDFPNLDEKKWQRHLTYQRDKFRDRL